MCVMQLHKKPQAKHHRKRIHHKTGRIWRMFSLVTHRYTGSISFLAKLPLPSACCNRPVCNSGGAIELYLLCGTVTEPKIIIKKKNQSRSGENGEKVKASPWRQSAVFVGLGCIPKKRAKESKTHPPKAPEELDPALQRMS